MIHQSRLSARRNRALSVRAAGTRIVLGAEMSPGFAMLALLRAFVAAQDPAQQGQTELAQVANLHRSVYESPNLSLPVYTAARELGLRYIEGRGIERDQIQGPRFCC